MAEERCVRCNKSVSTSLGIFLSAHDTTELGGCGFHCGRCAAEAVAEVTGKKFHYVDIEPITLVNAAGRRCLFHFQYLTNGPTPSLQAVEFQDGVAHGYEAAVLAEPGESSVSLIGRLLDKLHRLLARSDVVEAPELTLGLSMTSSEIRGLIAYDEESDGSFAVVDGRRLDWETLGQLLLSHEGFHFRLELRDPTDEF